MRLPVNHVLPSIALVLAGGIGQATAKPAVTAAVAPSGPAADYPVVVGEPYTIGKTTWTPADQLNYDAVGYAGMAQGLTGVSAAHKTLPLPSYAEITALDTGRTILVRLVDRGPQDNDTLVALSTAAAAQLGLSPGARSAVRVRRVNPPEVERAALRTGRTAPMRMETPESLLKVLRRKLAEQSPLMPPPSVPPAMPKGITPDEINAASKQVGKMNAAPSTSAPMPAVKTPRASVVKAPAATQTMSPPPRSTIASRPTPPAQKQAPAATSARKARAEDGTHVVQVAAFSTQDRAEKVARQLNGRVSQAGRFWRVRLGPFTGSGEAASALEKAKAAGYRDARIQRAD